MSQSFWERNWSNVTAILRSITNRLRPWRWWLAAFTISCLILPPVVEYYQGKWTREILILGGPPGSSGANLVERLKTELEQTENEYGLRYRARIVTTQGAEEMQRRLEADAAGTTVGFQFDNHSDTQQLRTVYPMDYDYLHVMCSARFLKLNPPGKSQSLRDVDRVLLAMARFVHEARAKGEPPTAIRRVYPGPPESTSRVFATQLFKLYDLDIDAVAHHGVRDWKQAQVALEKGDLDLVFFLGPKNADTIAGIAEDRTAVLLDLDSVRGSLADKTVYSAWPVEFPANSYSALPIAWPSAQTAAGTLEFCPEITKSIAARRLLACNAAMGEHDAYAIMTAADRAFGGDGPAAGLWDTSPPTTTSSPLRTGFGIRVHSVADLFQNKRSPTAWWWPTAWSPIYWGAAASLFLFLMEGTLSSLAKWVQSPPSPDGRQDEAAAPPVPEQSPRFALLADEIALTEQLIVRHGPLKTIEGWEYAHRGIDELRERVNHSLAQQTLSAAESAELTARLDSLDQKLPRPERRTAKTPAQRGD
ncbi:MAG: hypothetical protein SH850_27070 [Planctomycetaceae bacterium]|nr:hypothetical protein [Planctomycetaceae bacterium]